MKCLFAAIFSLISLFAVAAQDQIQTHINSLGIKNVTVNENPGNYLKKVYILNDQGKKGGIIVFYYSEVRTDVFVTLLKNSNGYFVQSINLINSGTMNQGRLKDIKAGLAKLNNLNEKQLPDAISSATRHTQGMYSIIQAAMKNGIPIIESGLK
jgi:hypothetical protein